MLKLFRNTIRRFPTLGRGEIYYHLTFIDDLVEGFRLCGTHPAAANRTYILAGGEVTTLNALVTLVEWAEALVASGRPVETAFVSISERRVGGRLIDDALAAYR